MGLRDLTFRKFRTEDARTVANIISKSLITSEKNNTEITPKYILTMSNKRKMYVALNDNTIVGTASIDHDLITFVFVDEKYRNQGVEGALISLLEEIAANNGIKLIKLEAGIAAQKLFERLGYNITDEIAENEFGSNVIMEKYLF